MSQGLGSKDLLPVGFLVAEQRTSVMERSLKQCSRAPPALGTPRRPGPGEPLPPSPPQCPSAEDHAHDGGTAARSGTGKRGFLAFPPSSVS
ncbi:unnamed protein product [Bubo scandiacus]